jgi:hypothetical protein
VEEPPRQWSLCIGGGARAPVDLCRRWRSPLVGGAGQLVEDPAHRWRSLCAGGSRSSVEEPTRQWSCVPVEPRAGGRVRSLVLGRLAAGGADGEVRGTLAHRRPIYRLDWD